MERYVSKIARMLVVAVFASLVLAAPACAANGKWLRAESKHFIAYGEVSERELREAVRELETLDSVLRWYLVVDANAEDGAKLEYYLVKNMNGIRLAQPSLDRQVAGFYMARPEVIAAVGMARDGGGYEGAGRQIMNTRTISCFSISRAATQPGMSRASRNIFPRLILTGAR